MERVCITCQVAKGLDQFQPFRTAKGTEGRRYKCKACQQAGRKPRHRGSKVRDEATRTKRCSNCNEWKPFAEFSPRSGERSHGLRAWCRACARAKEAVWRESNREAVNARRRSRPYPPAQTRRWNVGKWAKRLGMDADELRAYVERPEAICDICGRKDGEAGGRSGRLHIDHCHATGKFRGLLCPACNLALGKLKDDPELFRRAAEYLEALR